MYWIRVDNRLIHGQIIEAWIPFTHTKVLVVVNDALAEDSLRQDIMSLAIPNTIATAFVRVDEAASFLAKQTNGNQHAEVMVLFASCVDAMGAYEQGLDFEALNIGNLHYGPGKRQLCAHVAVTSEDETCLGFFNEHGVNLDFRCVPNDPVQVKNTW